MSELRVFADFHNADAQGRLRLNTAGTIKDLACQKISLREGLSLTLYSGDLEVDGRARYSAEERVWVAVIDWNAVRRSDVEGACPLKISEVAHRPRPLDEVMGEISRKAQQRGLTPEILDELLNER